MSNDYDDDVSDDRPYGLSNQQADEAFRRRMQRAIARGREQPRAPAQAADPNESKVLRTVHAHTIVPSACSLLNY